MDLISRQAAIELIESEYRRWGEEYEITDVLCDLDDLPTAEKKGKWISEAKGKVAILDEFGNVSCSAHCSECGEWLTASDEYSCRGNYCPNCGARMEE